MLILFWIVIVFFYQGFQFAKPMRYFYPLYPFLAISSSYAFCYFFHKRINNFSIFLPFIILFAVYPISFLMIYSRPHSRVIASEWIYNHIPTGSTLSCEHWDDCLPLPVDGKSSQLYRIVTLSMYDLDTQKKWERINKQLEEIDYLILSSNRLWGSIPRASWKYPMTSTFYVDLFSGKLKFDKIAEFTSRPTIPFLSFELIDDSADENFTVFDHPKVLIFRRQFDSF